MSYAHLTRGLEKPSTVKEKRHMLYACLTVPNNAAEIATILICDQTYSCTFREYFLSGSSTPPLF